MTDEEKIAHLTGMLEEPEGKYTHDQIKQRLYQIQQGREAASRQRVEHPSEVPFDQRPAAGSGEVDDNLEVANRPGLGPGGFRGKDTGSVQNPSARGATGTPRVFGNEPRTQEEINQGRDSHVDSEMADPGAQAMTAGALGAAAGGALDVVGGAVAPTVAPNISPIMTGATSNAVAAGAQGAGGTDMGRAALLGALLSVPGATERMIEQAPGATDARLQSAIDPSRGSSARRVAATLPAAREAIEETPGLKKTLITSGDVGEKAGAVAARNDELTGLTDKDWDAVGKFYGGAIPTRVPQASLDRLAEEARKSFNKPLMLAARRLSADIDELTGGTGEMDIDMLRKARNQMAAHVEALNPSGTNASVAALNQDNAVQLQHALNDSIARLGRQVPGLDVDAMMRRSGQVGSMIPIQKALDDRVTAAGLGPEAGSVRGIPRTPAQLFHRVADKVDSLPAKADYALSGKIPQAIGRNLPKDAMPPADPLIRAIRGRKQREEQPSE